MLQNSKTLSKKDKKILRNRISAQKSRNKKKEEFGHLSSQIDALKNKYQDLFEVLDETMCEQCKKSLMDTLSQYHVKRQRTNASNKGSTF